MAHKEMFICDTCLHDFKDILKIEQKKQYKDEKCGFCNKKRMCKWSRITYGKER